MIARMVSLPTPMHHHRYQGSRSLDHFFTAIEQRSGGLPTDIICAVLLWVQRRKLLDTVENNAEIEKISCDDGIMVWWIEVKN